MSQGRQYRFIGVLGEGGFGTVYLAEQLAPPLPPRRVAVKLLKREASDPSAIRDILRESEALASLQHGGIVSFVELVKLDGRLALVLEYIDGISLHELAQNTSLPLRASLEIISQLAAALHAAHSAEDEHGAPRGLVHRDVKPGNVMVTRQGEVKLLDFGLARANPATASAAMSAPATTRTGGGTPGYLPPEVEEGGRGRASGASDVFGLGVILHELLMGERLFGLGQARYQYPALRKLAERNFCEKLGEDHPARPLVFGMLALEPDDRPSALQVSEQASDLAFRAGGERLRSWAHRVVTSRLRRAENLPPGDYGGQTLEPEPVKGGEVGQDGPVGLWRRWLASLGALKVLLDRGVARAREEADWIRRWLKRVAALLTTVATLWGAALALWGDGGTKHPPPPPVVDEDHDGAPAASDCDDHDATVSAVSAWFPDQDDDTWGADAGRTSACHTPAGAWVSRGGDIDDANASVYPGSHPEPKPDDKPPDELPPPPLSPNPARVSFSGDASAVTLSGAGAPFVIRPGTTVKVPPGRYAVIATFDDYPGTWPAASLQLTSGQLLTLRCRSDSQTCSP